MASEVVTTVTGLVAPICADLGLELYDVDFQSGVVRVAVERSGGVDLDTISLVTRLLSKALDAEDPLPGRYTLEVTSPGLERPLRTPAHFARAVGAEVTVKTQPGVPGERRVHGTLASADETRVVVRLSEPDASGAEERSLAYGDIERARTVFRWGPTPAPKSPSAKKHTATATAVRTRKKAGAP
jgi:ribosome maturation factor RimP